MALTCNPTRRKRKRAQPIFILLCHTAVDIVDGSLYLFCTALQNTTNCPVIKDKTQKYNGLRWHSIYSILKPHKYKKYVFLNDTKYKTRKVAREAIESCFLQFYDLLNYQEKATHCDNNQRCVILHHM